MKYIHSIKTKGYLNETVEKISSSVEENGILLDKNLFIRELGGRSTGTGICKADSSSLSCSMGDRKNEMGVSAISVSIGNLSDESMLNHYVNMIYSSFVQKYLR